VGFFPNPPFGVLFPSSVTLLLPPLCPELSCKGRNWPFSSLKEPERPSEPLPPKSFFLPLPFYLPRGQTRFNFSPLFSAPPTFVRENLICPPFFPPFKRLHLFFVPPAQITLFFPPSHVQTSDGQTFLPLLSQICSLTF